MIRIVNSRSISHLTRFLRVASRTLLTPLPVQEPSKNLPDEAKSVVISKLLGDFILAFTKETQMSYDHKGADSDKSTRRIASSDLAPSSVSFHESLIVSTSVFKESEQNEDIEISSVDKLSNDPSAYWPMSNDFSYDSFSSLTDITPCNLSKVSLNDHSLSNNYDTSLCDNSVSADETEVEILPVLSEIIPCISSSDKVVSTLNGSQSSILANKTQCDNFSNDLVDSELCQSITDDVSSDYSQAEATKPSMVSVEFSTVSNSNLVFDKMISDSNYISSMISSKNLKNSLTSSCSIYSSSSLGNLSESMTSSGISSGSIMCSSYASGSIVSSASSTSVLEDANKCEKDSVSNISVHEKSTKVNALKSSSRQCSVNDDIENVGDIPTIIRETGSSNKSGGPAEIDHGLAEISIDDGSKSGFNAVSSKELLEESLKSNPSTDEAVPTNERTKQDVYVEMEIFRLFLSSAKETDMEDILGLHQSIYDSSGLFLEPLKRGGRRTPNTSPHGSPGRHRRSADKFHSQRYLIF